MAENTFNPTDWMPAAPAPAPIPSSSEPVTGDLADDIEVVTQRIEAAHTDITAGYDNWLELGFALSDALGESGRDYFHRISRFNEGYDQAECDRQYDKCMRSHGTGAQPRHSSKRPKTQESASVPAPYLQNPQLLQNLHTANLRIPLPPYLHKTKMRILRILPKLQIWRKSHLCQRSANRLRMPSRSSCRRL